MYNNTGYQQGGQFNGPILPQRTGQQPLGYQQTGYGQLPSQQTGFQTGYQQQQPPTTSFQSQLNQPIGYGAQQPLYGQPTGFVQPQQTGFVQPQQTGYVSNQFGQSQFGVQQQQQQQQQPLAPQKTGFSSAAQGIEKNEELKIPNIRLSFLAAHDQQKFEDLFRSAVPKKSYAIGADSAREVLMRSGLQPSQLARIWELSDLNKSGQLLFPEFALALHLCNVALKGLPIPYQLETNIKNEVEGFVDAINFSIPDDDAPQRSTPFDNISQPQQQSTINQLSGLQMQPPQTSFQQPLVSQATGYQPLQTQATGYQPMQPQRTGFQALQPQSTGYQPLQAQTTGFQQPLQTQTTGFQPNYNPPALLQQQKTGVGNNGLFSSGLLQQQKTGVGNNNLFQSSYLQPQRTGFIGFSQYQNFPPQENQEFIKPEEKALFSKIFDTYDTSRKGQLDPQLSAEIFRKSGLNRSELEKVWNLITNESTTHLSKESFSLGMWLIYRKLNGNELPNHLPDSLLPNSVKNVNYVKNQLKSTPSFTKPSTAFSNYKTDGNDMNSSKNRRKSDSPTDSKSSIDELREQVRDKQRELDSLNSQSAKNAESSAKELHEIEELKNKIRTLPKPNVSNDTLQQKDKLNALVSRVPSLISEISRIDNDITNSRIDLYKIQHPSSIVGSGPNGEVTESDKRKAKSKALLAQRMAALTGKTVSDPTADFENEQQQLNEEVARIKSKNKETQEIIYDIEKTIKEISQGVLNSLNKDNDPSSYKKWELGLDVQPDVAELIKSLRINSPTPQQTKKVQSDKPSFSTSNSYNQPAVGTADNTKPSAPDSYASYKSPEDRAAYIKEQAKRKMNERLAKFGISRHGASKTESPSVAASAPQVSTPPPPAQEKAQQAPVSSTEPQQESSFQAQAHAKAPPPPPTSRATPKATVKPAEEPEDDVDEEELKLRQQLEDLKRKKKADKEARLASLRKEIESAEHEEEEEEDDAGPQQPVKTFAPQPNGAAPQPSNSAIDHTEAPSTKKIEAEPARSLQHHDTNPFAKNQAPSAISSNNPFGKPQQAQKTVQPQAAKPLQQPSQTPSFDSKNAEAQRKAQRGFENDDNDDDGWGTEEDKSDEEDDIPNRQGAAHLAGLLFSGMGPPRTNSASQVSTPKQEENKSFENVKEKPVPIAAPVPSISSPVPSSNNIPQVTTQPQPLPETAPPSLAQDSPIPPTPPSPPFPTEEGPADDAFAAHPQPEVKDEGSQSDDDAQFVDSLSTPAASSPAPEVPALPESSAPQIPDSIPPPLPESNAPAPPPLPESSAPAPPPLPQVSVPETPSFTEQAPPLPVSSAPPALSFPETPAELPPPLPQVSAPAPPPLPQVSAPAPPPLPQSNAPPAPPAPSSSGSGVPAAPPPPPPGPAPPVSNPVAGGGLPFLADIQKRRDDSNVVG